MDEQSRVTNSMGNNWSSSISSNSFIRHISNITIISIGIVSHMLDATIRKSNRVRSSNTTSSISTLSSIKTRTGVVIIDSIGVGVWAGQDRQQHELLQDVQEEGHVLSLEHGQKHVVELQHEQLDDQYHG